jgi:hypothetical protein
MFKRMNELMDEIPVDGGEGSGDAPPPVDDVWNEMLADDGDTPDAAPPPTLESEVPSPSEEPSVPEPQPIVGTKPEEPKAPEVIPAQAATEPPAPVKPAEPSVPEASTPTAPPVDYAALRAQQIQALEKSYALPAEQATQLLTEPELVLPKLAAHLHQAVTEQVLAQIQTMLPQAVTTITAAQVRESEAKTEFYSAWPELRGYESQVLAAGNMFRQINPTATKEVAVQAIGQLAMQALGLQRAAPSASPPPPTPKPFQPAGVGASGVRPPQPQPTVWDEMLATDFE